MVFKGNIMSKLISNILIFIYFIIFSLFFSFAHAEDTLGDTVENLKTCGQGKTYDEIIFALDLLRRDKGGGGISGCLISGG